MEAFSAVLNLQLPWIQTIKAPKQITPDEITLSSSCNLLGTRIEPQTVILPKHPAEPELIH